MHQLLISYEEWEDQIYFIHLKLHTFDRYSFDNCKYIKKLFNCNFDDFF